MTLVPQRTILIPTIKLLWPNQDVPKVPQNRQVSDHTYSSSFIAKTLGFWYANGVNEESENVSPVLISSKNHCFDRFPNQRLSISIKKSTPTNKSFPTSIKKNLQWFKAFPKFFRKGCTPFHNAWTASANSDLLEESCVKILAPEFSCNRSTSCSISSFTLS